MTRWLRWCAGALLALIGFGGWAQAVAAQAPANCVIDAVLLIDRGGSAAPEDFAQMQALAQGIAAALPLGGVRLGVIGFDGVATTHSGLSTDLGAVSGAIGAVAGGGGAADFITALDAADAMLAEARPYTTRAALIITDGISARDARERARDLDALGLQVLVFGVGSGVNRRELGNLGLAYFDSTTTYGQAPAYAGQVAAALCRSAAVLGGRVAGRIYNERRQVVRILPVQGAEVSVLSRDGSQTIASTRTDSSGRYTFYLSGGIYQVRIHQPEGLAFSPGNDGLIPIAYAYQGGANTRGYTLFDVLAPATPAP